jgi:hypothetical protein
VTRAPLEGGPSASITCTDAAQLSPTSTQSSALPRPMHTKHDDARNSSTAAPPQTATTPATDVPKQTMNAATPNKHEGRACDKPSCSAPQLPATVAASKGGPSSQPSPEPHALLALATKIVGDYNMLQDLTAILMRTMLSPLALQGLRMIA